MTQTNDYGVVVEQRVEQAERDAEVALLDNADSAFTLLLRGLNPEPEYPLGSLGHYNTCYQEMLTAYDSAGEDQAAAIEAARTVLQRYACSEPAFSELKAIHAGIHRRSWSVADLYAASFPEPRFLVPDLLPDGLSALGARPKIGKSWLALQLAVAVGAGKSFFDQPTRQGRVLYLALEDSPRRMKNRLEKQKASEHANVRFEFGWPPLLEAGMDELQRAIDYHRYNLVIIDTLARALGYVDPNKAAEMNLHLGVLQRMAIERNMTILLIDHHRKGNGSGDGDVIDDLIGATAKAGVLDVALGLYRARGQKTAILKVTGRDIEEREMALDFDSTTGCWACLGDAETAIDSEQQQAVLDALKQMGELTCREVAEATDQKANNCHKRLLALVEKGKVKQLKGQPSRFMAVP